jgi:hypothetical protein
MPTAGEQASFPGYDVVARKHTWDAVTRDVVLARLAPTAARRFFSVEEEVACRPLLDRLLAQDEPHVPMFELIDARLSERETDGWRHDDMPEDTDAWKLSLAALDQDAVARHDCRFVDLGSDDQRDLLESIRTADDWHALPASRVWNLWMRYACAAFYSHPWAWNEIGFGGPAYPVGYQNIGLDKREHWEVREANAENPEPWARRIERARQLHRGPASPPPESSKPDRR